MSAEARAARKIAAQAYATMPSRETFAAATDYEKAVQASVAALDSTIIQRAQFAGMVLGNPEVAKNLTKEQMAEILPEAIAFTKKLLHQGHQLMMSRDKLTADDEPEVVDEA